MRIEVLQKLMGHERPETTLSYVDSLERNTTRQYHATLEDDPRRRCSERRTCAAKGKTEQVQGTCPA